MITSQLNNQLTVLSTLSVSQTGGDQGLAEDINKKAQKYLSDYADKASNGKSADKLLEKAAEWVDAAVAQVDSANPSGASAESIFAASASEPAEAASGSSTEETDAVAASVAKTDAAETSSDKSAPEKTVAASSTSSVETAATARRDAAGSRQDAPASGGGNGAKSENAETSSRAGAEHAWGTHKTRQGETPAKANRGEAAIAAAEGALNEKRDTFDLDALKSDDGPADPRLEAMKRALSQLKSLQETGGAAPLHGLSTGAQADPTDPKDALAPQSGQLKASDPVQRDSFIKAAVAYASARAATAS